MEGLRDGRVCVCGLARSMGASTVRTYRACRRVTETANDRDFAKLLYYQKEVGLPHKQDNGGRSHCRDTDQ